jgi:hypothetical protein
MSFKETEMKATMPEMVIKAIESDEGKEVAEKLTEELVAKALLAKTYSGLFVGPWKGFLILVGNEEMDDDVSSMMATIGFVSALFMSFTFGRNGHDFESHPNRSFLFIKLISIFDNVICFKILSVFGEMGTLLSSSRICSP